ncbi:MAG: DUF4280 domain-containing protein [Proteobacteria bacterium]|nr:DUF4280 domain-containing protein [Pseudomonadota bacterium]
MALAVVGMTSMLQCLFGLVPTPLIVLPDRTVSVNGSLVGNITDCIPFLNIEPFGECTSLANPEVLIATAAAGGVLTPMPCVPITPDPWISEALGAEVNGAPVLDQMSTLMCIWAGLIHVDEPGNIVLTVS